MARDILLARELGVHMCSFSPFVPAPDTPLAQHPPGDVEVALNAIAASRLVEPRWLVPSVSALAKNQDGGQYRGFAAGANVLTVNFTPDAHRDRYLIYGRDRFVVRRDYAAELLARTGLTPRKSVFVGSADSRADSRTGADDDGAGRPVVPAAAVGVPHQRGQDQRDQRGAQQRPRDADHRRGVDRGHPDPSTVLPGLAPNSATPTAVSRNQTPSTVQENVGPPIASVPLNSDGDQVAEQPVDGQRGQPPPEPDRRPDPGRRQPEPLARMVGRSAPRPLRATRTRSSAPCHPA